MTNLADLHLNINYKPFSRPTFVIGRENRRLVHGSCRRPGADGRDAFGVYDELLAKNTSEPLQRPASLILTGDQIYADDVAFGLFDAVRRKDARPGSRIFRKSGTWHQWHGDAALVERDGKRYVAVALCEDANGGNILERLIVALDDCVPELPVRTAGLTPAAAATAPGGAATAR